MENTIKAFKSNLIKTNNSSPLLFSHFKTRGKILDFKKIEDNQLIRDGKNSVLPIEKALLKQEFYILFNSDNRDLDEQKIKSIEAIKKEIDRIFIKQKEISNEKNIETLYIGHYFIEIFFGKDENDYFYAPLFLRKCSIERYRSGYKLVLSESSILNNSLLTKLSNFTGTNWEFSDVEIKISSPFEELKKEIIDILGSLNIELINSESFVSTNNLNFEFANVKTRAEKKDDFINENKTLRCAYASNVCSFGIYDIAESTILAAYSLFEDDNFFDELCSSVAAFDGDKSREEIDREIITFSDLDFSQKDAIATSLSKSTLIIGPPGTGKSQTITNLLANVIFRDKNAVFVTEKKVASLVVYDKLNKLSQFALMLHNLDAAEVYKKIKDFIYVIENYQPRDIDWKSELEKYETDISEIFNSVEKYKKIFTSNEGAIYQEAQMRLNSIGTKNILNEPDYVNPSLYYKILDNFNLIKKCEEFINLVSYIKFNVKAKLNFKFFENLYKNDNHIKEMIYWYWEKGKIKAKTSKRINLKIDSFYVDESNKENLLYINKIIKKCSWEDFKRVLNVIIFAKNLLKLDRISLDLIYKTITDTFYAKNIEHFKFMESDWGAALKDLYNSKMRFSNDIILRKRLNFVKEKLSSEMVSKYNELKNYIISIQKPRIKTLFKRFKPIIDLFFPILIGSPEAFANYKVLPMIKKEYEYSIFDEASQIFIEKCLPIFYKSKKIIVAGDDKQMAPKSIFNSRSNSSTDDFDDEEEDFLDVNQSLLDFTKGKFDMKMLTFHYRSKYKELIDFSNSRYYENKLNIVSSPQNCKHKHINSPIFMVDVHDGVWLNQSNEEEANKVVGFVEYLCSNKSFADKTIGIVTFNANQQKLINQKLEKLSAINTNVGLKYNAKSGEEIFVKNIENVQGDERDIIIFSIGYSYNERGTFENRFGSLNQKDGEKRLNVAITRAKELMIVVKSISHEVINANPKNRGAVDFRDFLHYVELVHKGGDSKEELANLLNNDTVRFDINDDPAKRQFDSEFEKEVFSEIYKLIDNSRFQLHTQVKSSTYRIDQAIFDSYKNKYILAIECDGYTYHSSYRDVLHDYERQVQLENRGWKFIRILSTHWWSKNKKQKNLFLSKVIEYIKNYLLEN